MPYIEKDRRDWIDEGLDDPKTAGELNYEITTNILRYLGYPAVRPSLEKLTYKDLNAVIGVLECAKLELYRRLISPYEDIKWSENGDVYK